MKKENDVVKGEEGGVENVRHDAHKSRFFFIFFFFLVFFIFLNYFSAAAISGVVFPWYSFRSRLHKTATKKKKKAAG